MDEPKQPIDEVTPSDEYTFTPVIHHEPQPVEKPLTEKTFSEDSIGSPKLFPKWGFLVLILCVVVLLIVGIYAIWKQFM